MNSMYDIYGIYDYMKQYYVIFFIYAIFITYKIFIWMWLYRHSRMVIKKPPHVNEKFSHLSTPLFFSNKPVLIANIQIFHSRKIKSLQHFRQIYKSTYLTTDTIRCATKKNHTTSSIKKQLNIKYLLTKWYFYSYHKVMSGWL